MLRVEQKPKVKTFTDEEIRRLTNEDIIVTKYTAQTVYNDDESYTVKKIPKKVNLTKKINESKKLIKKDTAAEKLAELEKIFTREK